MDKVDLYRVAQDIRDSAAAMKEYAATVERAADQDTEDKDLLERLYDAGGSALLSQIEEFDGDINDVIKAHRDLEKQGLELDDLIEKAEYLDEISAARDDWDVSLPIHEQVITILKQDQNKQAVAIERTKEILRQFALLLEETR